MNIDKLKNSVVGNKFYGVEIVIAEEQTFYYVILVHKEKNTLVVQRNFATSKFGELKEYLASEIPVLLSFSGQGVVNKKVDLEPNYRSKLLFNSDLKDFYWFEYQKSKEVFVSIARKQEVDSFVTKFSDSGFYVIQVALGAFVAIQGNKLFNKNSICTVNNKLVFEDGDLVSFSVPEKVESIRYKLEDQEVSSENIVGFSLVVNHLFANPQLSSSIDFVEKFKSEFIFKKLFSKIGMVAVFVLFGLLLINYLIFSNLTNKIGDISSQLALKQEAYNRVQVLQKDKKNKQDILLKSGIHNTHFLSYYAWSLISVIPKEIQLSRLEVFPVKGKIKKNEAIEFRNNSIHIYGSVTQNKSLSNWIAEMKKFDWVKSVEIIDFKNQKNNNVFVVKLKLKSNV